MPRIAEFFGIVIYMYEYDHVPPHFHARYQGDEAQIAIASLAVLAGSLPRAQLKKVRRWARDNQPLLWAKWRELSEKES